MGFYVNDAPRRGGLSCFYSLPHGHLSIDLPAVPKVTGALTVTFDSPHVVAAFLKGERARRAAILRLLNAQLGKG